jgi:hypothetical protein
MRARINSAAYPLTSQSGVQQHPKLVGMQNIRPRDIKSEAMFLFVHWFLRQGLSPYVVEADLEIEILLPQSLECWDFRRVPACLAYLSGCLLFRVIEALNTQC